MQFFILRDGVQQGPFSPEAVRSFLNEGALSLYDLGRTEDSQEWVALEKLHLPEYRPVGPPRTSGLAISSLSLAFLGVVTVIPSIAAIVCGHLALRKIKKSTGALQGQGMAVAGLILGYTGLILTPLLLIAGFTAGNTALVKAKNVTALATAAATESAVLNFHTDYGILPSATAVTDTSRDVSLARTLLGVDRFLNTKGIKFLSLRAAMPGKFGLDPTTFRIRDPWLRGYVVILDTGSTGDITVIRGSITETLKGRKVAVYSLGPDGAAGTADDVITW